jgi:hypothetical protein
MVNPGDAPSDETCVVNISVMGVVNSQQFCGFGVTSEGVINSDEVENLPVPRAMHSQTKTDGHNK